MLSIIFPYPVNNKTRIFVIRSCHCNYHRHLKRKKKKKRFCAGGECQSKNSISLVLIILYIFQDFATCFLEDQEIKHIQCRKENYVGLSFIKKGI